MTRLAWLTGDEASGTFLDVSGNGNNVAVTGLLTRTAAGGGQTYGGAQPNSKGITQTGVGTSAGPPLALVQTGAYTMCGWVKRSSARDGWILEGETGGSGDRGILFLSGNVQSRCKNGSGTVFNISTPEPAFNTAFFIATVCTGTILRLFMNSGASVVQIGSDVTVTGGVRTNSTGTHLFDTLGTETVIDDPQYYDTALNAAQLTAVMNTPFSGGQTIAVSPATETDAAQALGRRKTRAISPAVETTTAPSIGRRKLYVVGTAVEFDSGQLVARRKVRVITPAAESDASQPVGRRKQRAVATPVETDAAVSIGRRKTLTAAPSVESDAAVAVALRSASVVSPAGETGGANPIGRSRARAVAPATETVAALPAGRRRTRSVTPAVEIDVAGQLFTVTRRLVGPALEHDTAGPVVIPSEHVESVLTATNSPAGVLVASHTLLSRLEASHGV